MLAAAAALAAIAGHAGASEPILANGKLTIDTIPFALEVLPENGSLAVAGKALVLAAHKGTDLFANTNGSELTDKTPRVLFQPQGEFSFSARVDASFKAKYDGAALIVYGDRSHWAKLVFESAGRGRAGVTTTVTNGSGDDADHGERDGSTLYLRLTRRKDLFVFFTSPDGVAWRMVRAFGWPSERPFRIGLSSQSPLGERFSARYTEIVYDPAMTGL